jgi:hypothetical protein
LDQLDLLDKKVPTRFTQRVEAPGGQLKEPTILVNPHGHQDINSVGEYYYILDVVIGWRLDRVG